MRYVCVMIFFFFFQAEDGIRDYKVTGVQTCALPILSMTRHPGALRKISRASSAEIGSSNSMFTASEWLTNTGTRTQVAVSLILGSRIFLVSATIFHSSWVEPSSMKSPMCGITLNVMRLGNFLV